MLVEKSIDAVRVEVVAKTLGVTKGSFYWHYKDRADLLAAVLERWQRDATSAVIVRIERKEGTPEERLAELFELPNRSQAAIEGASLELAIRAWARRDAQARAAVDAVDEERLRYTAGLFQELGFPAEEARARAFLAYSYLIGESLMRGQDGPQTQRRRRGYVEALVAGKRLRPP